MVFTWYLQEIHGTHVYTKDSILVKIGRRDFIFPDAYACTRSYVV